MMGPGETIALLGVVTFLIVGLNLLVGAYKRRLAYKERALELKAGTPTALIGASELARLEKRVRVLERIATDRGQIASDELAARIEDLRSAERVHGEAA